MADPKNVTHVGSDILQIAFSVAALALATSGATCCPSHKRNYN